MSDVKLTLEQKIELKEKLAYEAKIFGDPSLPQLKRIEALRRFDALIETAYDVSLSGLPGG